VLLRNHRIIILVTPIDDDKSKKYHMEAIEELRAALKKYDD
jgi:hypothetical protein